MDQSIDLMDPSAWDDTALIDSWNEALLEYKRYHSIHARGEKVEHVVRQYQAVQRDEDKTDTEVKHVPNDDGVDEHPPVNGDVSDDQTVKDPAAGEHKFEPFGSATHVAANVGVGLPQALLATVSDEQLKNLMMAWYYAGYHTGLVEGQRKAQETILAEASKS